MFTPNSLQKIINKEINAHFLYIEEPKELYEPVKYVLSVGGKRLRPVLMLMACNLFSDDIEKAIKPALGIEIFHNFTLVHDDIMDNASLRRNRQTVHSKWNINIALLSGDAMSIKAYKYISECEPGLLKDILQIFNKAAMQVCEGQQYDMNFENAAPPKSSPKGRTFENTCYCNTIRIEDYLKMIELKTSALIAASVKIGALTGGASNNNSRLLYEFGRNIGIAFQLQDDILDVYGDVEIFGKKIGSDIVSNKKTFLLVKALELAKGKILTELNNYISRKQFNNKEKIIAVTNIYNKLRIKELAEKMMNEYFNIALNYLEKVSVDDKRKEYLKSFAKKIMLRVK